MGLVAQCDNTFQIHQSEFDALWVWIGGQHAICQEATITELGTSPSPDSVWCR